VIGNKEPASLTMDTKMITVTGFIPGTDARETKVHGETLEGFGSFQSSISSRILGLLSLKAGTASIKDLIRQKQHPMILNMHPTHHSFLYLIMTKRRIMMTMMGMKIAKVNCI